MTEALAMTNRDRVRPLVRTLLDATAEAAATASSPFPRCGRRRHQLDRCSDPLAALPRP